MIIYTASWRRPVLLQLAPTNLQANGRTMNASLDGKGEVVRALFKSATGGVVTMKASIGLEREPITKELETTIMS